MKSNPIVHIIGSRLATHTTRLVVGASLVAVMGIDFVNLQQVKVNKRTPASTASPCSTVLSREPSSDADRAPCASSDTTDAKSGLKDGQLKDLRQKVDAAKAAGHKSPTTADQSSARPFKDVKSETLIDGIFGLSQKDSLKDVSDDKKNQLTYQLMSELVARGEADKSWLKDKVEVTLKSDEQKKLFDSARAAAEVAYKDGQDKLNADIKKFQDDHKKPDTTKNSYTQTIEDVDMNGTKVRVTFSVEGAPCEKCGEKAVIDDKTKGNVDRLSELFKQRMFKTQKADEDSSDKSEKTAKKDDSSSDDTSDDALVAAAKKRKEKAQANTALETKLLNALVSACTDDDSATLQVKCAGDEFLNILKDSRVGKTDEAKAVLQNFYDSKLDPAFLKGLVSLNRSNPRANESYREILGLYQGAPSSADWLRQKLLKTASEYQQRNADIVMLAAQDAAQTKDPNQLQQDRARAMMGQNNLTGFSSSFNPDLYQTAQLAINNGDLTFDQFTSEYQKYWVQPMAYLNSNTNAYSQILNNGGINPLQQVQQLPYQTGDNSLITANSNGTLLQQNQVSQQQGVTAVQLANGTTVYVPSSPSVVTPVQQQTVGLPGLSTQYPAGTLNMFDGRSRQIMQPGVAVPVQRQANGAYLGF